MLPESWLCVRFSALGDVVLTTGVLDYWHKNNGWKFSFLTSVENACVLEGHPAVEQVIGLRLADYSFLQLCAEFRKISQEFSGVGLLDLHGNLRSRLLRSLWRGRTFVYPKYSIERRLFLQSQGKLFGNGLMQYNVTQRYALALNEVAPGREELLPRLFLQEREVRQAQDLLPETNSRPWVALHPYSTHPNKAWCNEYWKNLAEKLQQQGYSVVCVGRGESPFVESNGVVDLSNKTTLREVCAVLACCSVLVTGDSGPMHLASGVEVPVVGLFGPTHRAWGFFPEGPRDIVLEADASCRPCSLHGKKACKANILCMEQITPERVLEAVNSLCK